VIAEVARRRGGPDEDVAFTAEEGARVERGFVGAKATAEQKAQALAEALQLALDLAFDLSFDLALELPFLLPQHLSLFAALGQEALGELVYVELPEPGRTLAQGEACAVVESVKTASDSYSPVAGTVTEVNPVLGGSPALVNTEPYQGGWFYKLKLSGGTDGLLSPEAYRAQIGA
jgi:glycine cleavage system H protein